jgi:hypothetical protein
LRLGGFARDFFMFLAVVWRLAEELEIGYDEG